MPSIPCSPIGPIHPGEILRNDSVKSHAIIDWFYRWTKDAGPSFSVEKAVSV